MIRLLRYVGRYRTAALLTPLWTTLEVVMGILIPYVTASLIDAWYDMNGMSATTKVLFVARVTERV